MTDDVSKATFNINASATIAGAMIASKGPNGEEGTWVWTPDMKDFVFVPYIPLDSEDCGC